MRFLRYALATVFLAASVGFLALWWRSMSTWDLLNVPSYFAPARALNLQTDSGSARVMLVSEEVSKRIGFGIGSSNKWRHTAMAIELRNDYLLSNANTDDRFGRTPRGFYFPIWYAALVFALAGVGILRFGRFTIRSALIVTTIVALLLGMPVIL